MRGTSGSGEGGPAADRAHTEEMEFRGVLPEDAPDPSIAAEARLRAVEFPVFDLRPQPSITRMPITGFTEGSGSRGVTELSAQFSYTLWRHPDDHSDPRNEIELDEQTRRALDEEPPWPRPTWLIERAQLFRYPMLWEAVRTAWHREPDPGRHGLATQLVDHANHVLENRFRDQLGLPSGPGAFENGRVKESAVAQSALAVDGEERPGLHVDTDPFVYAVGFRVDEHVVCTVVLPRDSLPFLDLALVTFR